MPRGLLLILAALTACGRDGFDGRQLSLDASTTTDSDTPVGGADPAGSDPLMLCPSPPPFAFVQSVPGTTQNQVQQPTSFQRQTINQTAGNLLVAVVYVGQEIGGEIGTAPPDTSIAIGDTLGNTFDAGPRVAGPTRASFTQMFYAANITGGANTVTAALSGDAANWIGLLLLEYAGIDTAQPVEVASFESATNSATATLDAGTLTPSTCDLVVAAFADGGVHAQGLMTPAGWSLRASDLWAPAAVTDNADTGAGAGTPVTATLTETETTSTSWVAVQMAFRPAGTTAIATPTKATLTVEASGPVTTWQCLPFLLTLTDDAGAQATTTARRTFGFTPGQFYVFADKDCRYPVVSGEIGAGLSVVTGYVMAAVTGSAVPFELNVEGALLASTTINVSDHHRFTWKGGCSPQFDQGACWYGGAAPGASDVAHFDDTCAANCDVTVGAATVERLWLHPGYAHTVTHIAGALVVREALVIEAGTFDVSGTGLSVGRIIDVKNGAFSSSAASLTTGGIRGAISTQGSTINAVLGSLITDAAFAQPIVVNASGTIGALTINVGNHGDELDDVTVSVASAIIGSLNIFGNGVTKVDAPLVVNVSGSPVELGGFRASQFEIMLTGSANQSLSIGAVDFSSGSLHVTKSTPSATVTLQSDVEVPAVDVTSGTLALNGHVLTVGNDGKGAITVGGALECGGGCGAGTACNQGADLICGALVVDGGTVTP